MKVRIPDTILSTELQKEGVLLNLETGEYFGLDEVGMDMWKILGSSDSVEAARTVLIEQYEVSEEVLTHDLDQFITTLAERGLVVIASE
jgi:hypothetical protein